MLQQKTMIIILHENNHLQYMVIINLQTHFWEEVSLDIQGRLKLYNYNRDITSMTSQFLNKNATHSHYYLIIIIMKGPFTMHLALSIADN